MKPKIIAVDFDGCLVTNRHPDIGEPIPQTIAALKAEQAAGAKVILWTCRRDEALSAAVDFCTQQGIHLDAVNANLPEVIASFGGDTRKIFANEYWDDRAVRMPTVENTTIKYMSIGTAQVPEDGRSYHTAKSGRMIP